MPSYTATRIESVLQKSPSMSLFFAKTWISKETRKLVMSQPCHPFLRYLVSPYGYVFGAKANAIFGAFLTRAKSQVPRLRKKIVDANAPDLFKSTWFEAEISFLLLEHGYPVHIEPLGRKQEGPDVKTMLLGRDVYVEAKKLGPHTEVVSMWKRIFNVDKLLVRGLEKLIRPVDVYFTLTPRLNASHEKVFIKDVIRTAEKLATSGNLRQRVECKASGGQIMAEADVYFSDADVSHAFGGWIRGITVSSRDKENENKTRNLEDRYLTGRQFPSDGLHVLIVDTSVLDDGDMLMSQLWEQAFCPSIHCLVLCHRQANHRYRHWLNDLTVDPIFIQNSLAPLPDSVFDSLKQVFQ